jgi:hypothetical protein
LTRLHPGGHRSSCPTRVGWPRELPSRGSHRSGRAGLPHPAPRLMDSLRTNLTRTRPTLLSAGVVVTRCSGSESPPCFPPSVPCSYAPFPPQGPDGSVPLLSRYYEAFRLPDDPPAQLRSPSPQRYHRYPSFAPVGVGRPSPTGQGCCPASLTGSLTWSHQGLPGSWGTLCARAPLSDPGETSGPGPLRPLGAAFRSFNGVGSRTIRNFRGSITRPVHSLSTLRSPGLPGTTQDSLPAGGLLCRAGVAPAGSLVRFPLRFDLPHRFLLTQASPGALNGYG